MTLSFSHLPRDHVIKKLCEFKVGFPTVSYHSAMFGGHRYCSYCIGINSHCPRSYGREDVIFPIPIPIPVPIPISMFEVTN